VEPGAIALSDPRLLLAPTVEGLIPRPQLLVQTDRTLLVVAPAGYGKSSLLAQWAATKQGARWITLPSTAEDPAFLIALIAAAAGLPAPSCLTPELLIALAAYPLVLDDCQHVASDAARSVLDILVDTLPAEALALGSRVEPNLPALGRRRVRRQLYEVGAAQLAFRGKELGALCKTLLGHSASASEQAALERVTEGWAALLVLATPYIESAGQAALSTFGAGDTTLYDYLAAEVLDTLPAESRQATLEASLLPRLGPESVGAELLRTLDRRRLLIRAEDGVTRVFHPLLAEFLRQRLREEQGEAVYKRLCREAGTRLLAAGNWAEAFPLLRDGDDWEAIADWLDAQKERHPFRVWVRLLPEAVLGGRPQLALRRANCHLDAGDYPAAGYCCSAPGCCV
jgi:LuxR family transcriptional regulator, maltose regulon positive regulatory protein